MRVILLPFKGQRFEYEQKGVRTPFCYTGIKTNLGNGESALLMQRTDVAQTELAVCDFWQVSPQHFAHLQTTGAIKII